MTTYNNFVTIKSILPHKNTSKPVPHSPAHITPEEEKTKRTFTKSFEQTKVRTPVPLAGVCILSTARVVRTPSPPQKVPLTLQLRSRSTPNYAIESLSEDSSEEVEEVPHVKEVQNKVNTIYQLQSTYPKSPEPSEISMEVATYALQWYDASAFRCVVQEQREQSIPLPSYSRAYRTTDSEEAQTYAMLLEFIEKQQKPRIHTL